MTPDELARAAAKGDIDAFETLLGLYQNKVYGLALRMCGSEEDAWDVAQEAFLAAWRALPGFRGESGFSTWLYRLTANAAIDCLRREKKRRGELSIEGGELPLSLPDAGPSPQEAAEGGELRAAVNAALARLTDQHRTVLILRELQELSYEEIAGALGLDLGTVKSRISRARKALRKILLEDGNLSGYLPSKDTEQSGRGARRPCDPAKNTRTSSAHS